MTQMTSAAVLVPLFKKKGEEHLIFTKRAETLRLHKGQICFPGGVQDPSDANLQVTALRETQEEIGLACDLITIEKQLRPVYTPTRYEVTPFVGIMPDDIESQLVANPSEIDHIFSVPLSHLKNPQNVRYEDREYEGQVYSLPFFSYKDYVIWGMTGRVLVEFLSHF